MVQTFALTFLIGSTIAMPISAAEIDINLFGRSVAITGAEDHKRLTIDGREILKNYYVRQCLKRLAIRSVLPAQWESSFGRSARYLIRRQRPKIRGYSRALHVAHAERSG